MTLSRLIGLSTVGGLFLLVGSCGDGDGVLPPPGIDAGPEAGHADAGAEDAAVDGGTVDADECSDDDGDGHGAAPCGDDCDDADSSRFPSNAEVCDADDEDCDDTTYGVDADGDGYESNACCNGAGNCGADCDDTLNTVNPGAAEQCNGGVDDDCDGLGDSVDGVCVPCPVGYSGFDGDCTDVDECATSGSCGTGSTACTNMAGTFQCTCAPGYRTAGALGALCENIDECAAATNPCGVGTCTDNAGSYVCTCPSGYRLATSPAITCVDIDECAEGADLCTDVPIAACANTAGNYACTCPPGYEGSGRGVVGCAEVDECARGLDDCDAIAVCANAVGTFNCACVAGFVGTGHGTGSCLDVNECAAATTCVQAGGNGCANTTGGYACACIPGFVPSGLGLAASCANVDECAMSAWQCGRTLANGGVNGCTDTSGGYTCTCGAGFVSSGSGLAATCANVNECTTSAAQCGRTLSGGGVNGCEDTSGGYLCACGPGFVASGSGPTASCVNVNECATSAQCGRTLSGGGVNGCTDTSGGYTCACGSGFAASGSGLTATCGDVDECAGSLDDCEAVVASCTNTVGTFTCPCVVGFTGTGHGPGACRWNDPSLATLTFGAGATISPVFSPSATTYVLTLPSEAISTTVTPTVAQPARATIVVAGSVVASGASTVVDVTGSGFAPRVVTVVVTTETSATRTYTLVVRRSSTYFKASNTGAGDAFGTSVSLSADGTRLAVGAEAEDSSATGINGNQTSTGAVNSGAVYVFSRTGTTWIQEAYVKASNTGASDYFGQTVVLSADGTRLVVGVENEDSSATDVNGNQADDSALNSGAVYVFARTGTTWAQEAYVKASNTGAGDQFGRSVSFSADATRLAVGAVGEDSSATGVDGIQADAGANASGAVYMFSRTGTTWTQDAYVKASNTGAFDGFGSAVSLSADGTRLAASAIFEASSATGIGGNQADDSASASGAAYVFLWSGTTWAQEAYVKASNTNASDLFGCSISLSADGSRLAVGAFGEASSAAGINGNQADNGALESGAVYVFSRTAATWTQEAYVKASNTGSNDLFGTSVSLSADGTRLAVGAPQEASSATGINGNQADNTAAQSGAAYVFSRTGSTWTQEAYVKSSNTGANDHLGRSVALSADGARLATRAPTEASGATGINGNQADNSATNSGAAYVY